MRFIIMHKTNTSWEAGAVPSPELIARVGGLLGDLGRAGTLVAAEGLRPSSEGMRVRFAEGERTAIKGPFESGNELPAGFSILRTKSLDDAVEWTSRQAEALGDGEVDIRPVTEPWDIGMVPKPGDVTTRRYMVLRKATAPTEAGIAPSPTERAKLSRVIEETTRTGVHLAAETMRPSARGRRYKRSQGGISYFDGPFVESKELIGGYVIVAAESLEHLDPWVRRYLEVVDAAEVDVRELEPLESEVQSR